MVQTIGETTHQLHGALRNYIEATNDVSHPLLVAQRRRLLDEPGVIHQRPYLESTPRYQTHQTFGELGLDEATIEMFSSVSRKEGNSSVLIHDPPYQHQADSVRLSLVEQRSLVVTTG